MKRKSENLILVSTAPDPFQKAIGSAPTMAANVVIMIGLKRNIQASRIAFSGDMPWLRWASKAKSIIKIAFFLTIPIRSRMPIDATTVNSKPKIRNANIAPMAADGKPAKIVSG